LLQLPPHKAVRLVSAILIRLKITHKPISYGVTDGSTSALDSKHVADSLERVGRARHANLPGARFETNAIAEDPDAQRGLQRHPSPLNRRTRCLGNAPRIVPHPVGLILLPSTLSRFGIRPSRLPLTAGGLVASRPFASDNRRVTRWIARNITESS
jgi:hypothetical protein